jgi:ribosome-binding protein aMBF1 (putative translation factor)
METCALCKKQLVMKSIIAIIDLKTKDIADGLHISPSLISRHLCGEIERPEVDIFIIEKLLGIKIEGYKSTDGRVNN